MAKNKDIFTNFALFFREISMKIKKKRYIQGFFLVVLALAIWREIDPEIALPSSKIEDEVSDSLADSATGDGAALAARNIIGTEGIVPFDRARATVVDTTDAFSPHRIYSVSSYTAAFPDSNHVHMEQSLLWGVGLMGSREDIEGHKNELVYVDANPYFDVDRLENSVPYLVPRASILLQDIGHNFFDSLQVKGIPLHKIIVSSVLRSSSDVQDLGQKNGNASQNSCHQYATTFDICYNRYRTVEAPDGPHRREVRNDTLKWVLSEVLNDLRKDGRCLVKYERQQPCFHVTVK